MSRFKVSDLPLDGLKLVERKYLGDGRGFLSRLFCSEELVEAGFSWPIAQINQTHTQKCGTVRGMHFQQPPHSEIKLVSCLRGAVWDVAVDIRFGSPTFLNWHAEELSAENRRALLIPEGFAHGLQTLSDDAELLYCHSAAYNAEFEDGLNPRDSTLHIDWPLEIIELSDRDANQPALTSQFSGIVP